jgi:hypothetical protein
LLALGKLRLRAIARYAPVEKHLRATACASLRTKAKGSGPSRARGSVPAYMRLTGNIRASPWIVCRASRGPHQHRSKAGAIRREAGATANCGSPTGMGSGCRLPPPGSNLNQTAAGSQRCKPTLKLL